jgi:hypothetical protein
MAGGVDHFVVGVLRPQVGARADGVDTVTEHAYAPVGFRRLVGCGDEVGGEDEGHC